MTQSKVPYTSILNKPPTFRDDSIKSCWKWLEGRQADDNAEGLWRVHDKLYDLKDFARKHPGGKEWIKLSRVRSLNVPFKTFSSFLYFQGIDITEAFEAYHISDKASKILPKFYIRDALEPRNYKLSFEDDGFYRTLKRRVSAKLPNIDKSDLWKSKLILDVDVVLLFVTAILAIRLENFYVRILMVLFSGQLMGWLHAMAHNFIHQPNNWRMYAINMMLVGWRDWRVFHGIVSK
jgi:cytochrome b involved in lipid metabolism